MSVTSKQRILMIGINTFPELTGIGKYSGEMALWLAGQGHTCTVISTPPYYPQWKIQPPYTNRFYKKEVLNEGRLVLYRCPFYVPAVPSGLKRVIHEATFFLSAFFVVVKLLFEPKHDRIFCVAPPFHLGFLALFYRFFKGGELTYHIQDLQIEAARDLKVLRPDQIFAVLFALERFILRRVDRISTISTGMQLKVTQKARRQVGLLPNWADTEQIHPLPDRAQLKQRWGFSEYDCVVLYSGSIGEKQGLEMLIHSSLLLADQPAIKLVICGTGPYRQKLELLARERGASITFLPLQPSAVFNEFINMADVHLVIQKGDAGDLVMPSKLMTLLAAGALSIVTAHPGTSLYTLVSEHRMGLLIEPENTDALVQAIRQAAQQDDADIRRAARAYAERYLSRDALLSRFVHPPTV